MATVFQNEVHYSLLKIPFFFFLCEVHGSTATAYNEYMYVCVYLFDMSLSCNLSEIPRILLHFGSKIKNILLYITKRAKDERTKLTL